MRILKTHGKMEQEESKGRMRKAPYTVKQMADLIKENCDFHDEEITPQQLKVDGNVEDYEIKDGDLLIYITYKFWQKWRTKQDCVGPYALSIVRFVFECDRIIITDKEGNDYGITFSLREMENAVESAKMRQGYYKELREMDHRLVNVKIR